MILLLLPVVQAAGDGDGQEGGHPYEDDLQPSLSLYPSPTITVVKAAGDGDGQEGGHPDEDGNDEDAHLHPGHPVVRPAHAQSVIVVMTSE